VLVEDRGASASGAGLAEQPTVALEGRNFRRFLAQDVKGGATITVNVGEPTGTRENRGVIATVLGAGAVMAMTLLFALTRRRQVRVVPREHTSDDAAHLARDIAELDDAFERVASPSDEERASYKQRRDALKTRLAAALANEEVAV
jgi:hypothetical protein